MPNLLIRICDALFCVLLLRRAILVEVVELAAGEHVAVGPLAVCFLKGPLSTPLFRRLAIRALCRTASNCRFERWRLGVDNHLRRRRA